MHHSHLWRCGAVLLCLSCAFVAVADDNGAAPVAPTTRERIFTGDTSRPVSQPGIFGDIKHPLDWFTWGADSRLRQEYVGNAFLLNTDPPGHTWDFGRYRFRIWDTIAPSPALEINTRLAWESRYWEEPESKGHWDPKDVFFDALNVKLKLGDDVPVTVTAGRQDIFLNDGWLVLEGTPLYGSTATYFDAVRTTVDLKSLKSSADLIFLQDQAHADGFLQTIGNQGENPIEQNERGAIMDLSTKCIPDTQLDGYFIYKHDDREAVNGDQGDIYTFGGRAAHSFDEHWKARLESAYEFGQRNNPAEFGTNVGDNLSAWGLTSRLTYAANDSIKDQLYLGYEYLSGQDPNSKTNTQFDPLWGRWPQWSEYYIYTYAAETRVAEITNLHRVTLGWQADPTTALNLGATYSALFSATEPLAGTPGFGTGDFRGHLFTAVANYKLTSWASAQILGECFLPGNYYASSPGVFDTRRDPGVYGRFQLVLTY